MSEFLQGLDICPGYTPEKEPWAHGIVERAMAEIKDTAQILILDSPGFRPELALQLSASANNGVEVVKGYTPIQWKFPLEDRVFKQGVFKLKISPNVSFLACFFGLLQPSFP